MNTVLNKAKIPIIPPLLENGIFVTDFTEKAQLFNDYFILQCTTIDTGSHIPQDALVTDNMISDFVISDEKILNIIRALNPNKAHGWDEISVRMIKFSDVALVNPLITSQSLICLSSLVLICLSSQSSSKSLFSTSCTTI